MTNGRDGAISRDVLLIAPAHLPQVPPIRHGRSCGVLDAAEGGYSALPLDDNPCCPLPLFFLLLGASLTDHASPSLPIVESLTDQLIMTGEFNFSDFNAYQAPSISTFATADSPHDFRPLQPSHGPVYGNEVHPPQQHAQFAQSSARTGEKRKAEGATPPSRAASSMEEASRLAAEEDKRRRNTAASARFRIKKKQREQALEKTAKEMGEKVSTLESRVTQLETENRWLKSLLTEKNEGTEDITALWKEFTKQAGKRGTLEAAKESR